MVSIHERRYNVFFMDGNHKDNVPQKDIRKVPPREKKNPMIGKIFFDKGDYKPGRKRRVGDFKPGEFKVLCKHGGKSPGYWCERLTNIRGTERDISSFGIMYVNDLISEYEQE